MTTLFLPIYSTVITGAVTTDSIFNITGGYGFPLSLYFMNRQSIIDIGSALSQLSRFTSLAHIALIKAEKETLEPLFEKILSENYTPISFESIKDRDPVKKADVEGDALSLKHTSSDGKVIYMVIIPLFFGDISYYLMAQSSSDISEIDVSIITMTGKLITAVNQELFGKSSERESKYKEEIMKIRNTQARLFPKFDNLKGIDAAAIYLPADLMTGDFIDALHLNDELYQIVACDIAGQDASSSFAGAAVRTLVRSFSSPTVIPSALIELINTRVQKLIQGINSLLFITVFQINTRTGKTTISSYGEINTVYYSIKKKGYIHINKTPMGQNLAKKVVFKDMSLVLDPGDSLLYYTRGAVKAPSEDKKEKYGEDRIIQNYKHNIELSPLELVHSLSETIYEFTNYSNPKDDIILLCIKKT